MKVYSNNVFDHLMIKEIVDFMVEIEVFIVIYRDYFSVVEIENVSFERKNIKVFEVVFSFMGNRDH